MLTRLQVSGFKNLVDVDIRFGPFTCIAGMSGVGKSNLFDAIQFLSAVSGDTLMNAALSVRGGGNRSADIKNIFHHTRNDYGQEMSFEVEMIIPAKGFDDLGQQAKAGFTFLRYTIVLARRVKENRSSLGSLEVVREELKHINKGDAHKHIRFPHRAGAWRQSVVHGRRTSPFISTIMEKGNRIILISQDGTGGRPRSVLASNLSRSVLSMSNAVESPTSLLARREMQSWRQFQLEPSSLRKPDTFTTSPGLDQDGSHLPATLVYAARQLQKITGDLSENAALTRVCDHVAASLCILTDDVYAVQVVRDDHRELLTLEITDRDGTIHPVQSISDGTLRLLALAVLELETPPTGLICLEEPENGNPPQQIPGILEFLQNISTDVSRPAGPDNPQRQVIISTHSPDVVNLVPDDSLLLAERKEFERNGQPFNATSFSWLPDTWRQAAEPKILPAANEKLIAFLNPISTPERLLHQPVEESSQRITSRRVVDRPDLQPMLPFWTDTE